MVSNSTEFYQPITVVPGQVVLKDGEKVEDLPKLLQPISIKSVTLPNRSVVSPMCMYSSEDGYLTDFHLVHYGQYALSGVGLIIVEATAVQANGRITPYCAGIYHEEHVQSHKRVVDFVHNVGGKIGIQIAHAGRKASTLPPFAPRSRGIAHAEDGGWTNVVGPSNEIWGPDNFLPPQELTIDQIKELVESFKDGARRANDAGYDVLEIHGAHGYLIHSFVSPISNHRTDQYGGSFENRTRFLLEIIDAVNQVWPKNKPLFVRLSCTDWIDQEETWDLDQTVQLAHLLKENGVDLIDCSSSGNSPKQHIPAAPGFQVPFAHRIREETGVLTGAVGLITTAQDANQVLEDEKADLIFMAREYLRDAAFIKKAGIELNQHVKWSNQYERGRPRPRHEAF